MEHKKPISDLNLQSLVREEVPDYDSASESGEEGMTKKELKKRQRKLLKKIKKSKLNNKSADGKQSSVLSNLIKNRSEGWKEVDIVPLLKEYFKYAVQYGTNVGNVKYVINYTLRTHYGHRDLFNDVNECQTMESISKVSRLHTPHFTYSEIDTLKLIILI